MADKPVQIRLPEDHPIFSYARGERAGILRRWIDTGRSLEKSNDELVEQMRMVIREELKSFDLSLTQKGDGPGKDGSKNRRSGGNHEENKPLKAAQGGFMNLSGRADL
jgi:hypothetical protein